MTLKLIDRSILSEMIVPFLIGQAAIVLMLIGSVLYNNATILLQNQVPVQYVFRMVLYFIPFLIHMTMPVAMAVAASLAVSRLCRDSEITVMRVSGASLVRIFMPIYLVGLIASVADFCIGEYVVPPSIQRFGAVLAEIPSHIPHLQPPAGEYIIASDKSYVIFVNSMIPKRGYIEMHGIQISSSPRAIFNGSAAPIQAYADSGRYEDGWWILDHPSLFTYTLDGQKVTLTSPMKLSRYIAVDPQSFQNGFALQLPMWTMANSSTRTFADMGRDLKRQKAQGIHDVNALLDYHFKLSIPFSCLVMALCCPPLALRFAKGGGFMGTLLSICLVFVYWNTMLLFRILGSPGANNVAPLLQAEVAAWSQNILFVVLGVYFLKRSE